MRRVAIIVSLCTALLSVVFIVAGVWYIDILMLACSTITGCVSVIIIQGVEISDLKKDKEFTNYMNNNGL